MSVSISNCCCIVWEKQTFPWDLYRCTLKSSLLLVGKHFLHLIHSDCIPIYVSMYLCMYVSIHLCSYPAAYGISELASDCAWHKLWVHNKMATEATERFTWRLWSSIFDDALGGCDDVHLVDHLGCQLGELTDKDGGCDWVKLETMIDEGWRCTWRLWSSDLSDKHGGGRWVRSIRHIEALIKSTQQCIMEAQIVWTGRPWSCECRGAYGDHNSESFEMHSGGHDHALRGCDHVNIYVHWEAMMIWVQRCTWAH